MRRGRDNEIEMLGWKLVGPGHPPDPSEVWVKAMAQHFFVDPVGCAGDHENAGHTALAVATESLDKRLDSLAGYKLTDEGEYGIACGQS